MQRQGTLFIVSAPSGAGKTSLVNALVQKLKGVALSISYTTRTAREGEKEGEDYFFVEEATFRKQRLAGNFLEHAQVFGQWYGTSQAWVETQLKAGQDVLLEIDWQGARVVREKMHCVGIFILPPSREILHARLLRRNQDNHSIIEQRMAQAGEELSHYSEYDYLVINDEFEVALYQLMTIIEASRLTRATQQQRYQALLDSFALQ